MPSDNLTDCLVTMRKWRYWGRRYATVWFDGMPKQEDFFRSTAKQRFLSGGVRSGKSEAGARELALLAWGVKGLLYPGWPKDGKKRLFWAVALSTEKQRDPVKMKLEKFLGPGVRWREAENTFVLSNGTQIILKTQEADPDKFQSSDIDGAWFDEIGKEDSRYKHTLDRLIDRRGIVWTTYAPTRGMGWYYKTYEKWQEGTNGIEREHEGVHFIRLFTEKNAFLPQSEVAERKRSLGSDEEYRVKFLGEMVELRGLIYQFFDPERHVLKCLKDGKCQLPPPKGTPVYRGHDYGHRFPAATVWTHITPRDRILVVHRELNERNLSVPQLAFRIRQLSPESEAVAMDVADPALWQEEHVQNALGKFVRVKDFYHEAGIPIVPGNNRWQTGVELISQLLGGLKEAPRIQIHECCRALIREFRQYHWPEGGADRPGAKQAMGRDDTLDALRYVAMAVKQYLEMDFKDDGFLAPRSGVTALEEQGPPDEVQLLVPTVKRVDEGNGRYHYERFWMPDAQGEDDGFQEA